MKVFTNFNFNQQNTTLRTQVTQSVLGLATRKNTPVNAQIDYLSLRFTLFAAVASESIAFGALQSICSRNKIDTREEGIEKERKRKTQENEEARLYWHSYRARSLIEHVELYVDANQTTFIIDAEALF